MNPGLRAPPGAGHDGAGVTLWPNAGFVLADLELLDEVLALGGTPAAMHRYDAQGRSLGGLDIEPLDRLMGYPTCAILRTDLQAVLLRRAREAGVPVAFGREATAIANDPDGRAVVHFADGGRLSPDLVIGADGRMSSVARAHVAGGNAPVYQGFVNWIGVAESSRDLVDGAAIHDYWGHGERVGIVALGRRKVYWAGAQAQTLEQARASAAAAQDGEWRKVRRLFESWPDPIGAVIDATPPRALRLIAVHDLEPLARWHRGNVLLVGDAAHAPCPRRGRAPARRWRMPGIWRAAWRIRPWGRARNWSRRWNGSADCGGRRRRPSHGRRGTSRESCSSRTRRLAASATHACAPAIRCKACMRWRKAGGGACFAGAGAGRSRGGHRCRQRRGTVAVTSATSWLGGRGE